ncbi:MAG: response regulator [Candidatus Edwardsbacteria bacterium]
MPKAKILVVDDEVKLVEIIRLNLEKAGYEVFEAYNGEEALMVMKEARPDLIIADIMMPKMNGYQLCRRVRQNPEFYSIGFIFLTAKAHTEDEVKGLWVGADDYVTKPFDIDRLLARVEARLKRTQETKERAQKGELSGKITSGQFIDILQVLELGKRNGVLTVKSGTETGYIYIREGKVAGVHLEVKDEKAIYEILEWKEGEFHFEPREISAEKRLSLSVQQLLLEWAKHYDECKK